ncbi:MAG: DEAD/DEAH box helicase [Thermosyntropha sp.]|nr:DEAD/DEAH box helicase [Thermosyntropha sp.]
MTLEEDFLCLYNCYKHKETIKQIDGRRWDAERKCWVLPNTAKAFQAAIQNIPNLKIDKSITQRMTEIAFQKAQTEIKQDWYNAEPIEPMPIKVTPYRHQIHAFNLGISRNAAAFFMEMGTGKTLPSIAVAGHRYLRGKIHRLLVVCPASVMPVWKQEFEKFADFPYRVEILDGPVKKRCQTLAERKDTDALQVVVLNYEGARNMVEELLSWAPDMLIFDEAHRVKTPGSQQSKALARIGRITRYRLALTGTPITNNPLDVYGIYRTLDPSIFGTSFWAFKNRYAIMGGWEGKQVVGYQHIEELAEKIHRVAFRVKKDECLDLPEMTDVYRTCHLEPKAQAIYGQMVRESVAELEAGETVIAANVLSKLLRLSQIAGGFLDGQQVSTAKLNLLSEILDDLEGQKIVIFARFTKEKEAIEKLLAKKKIDFVSLDGSTPMEERGALVERFQTDPNCQVFVGQITAAGTGITLHAAHTAIFYSCSFSYSDLDQARSRLHRSGQKHPVTNIFLVCQGTVDEKIHRALAEKRDIAATIIDNWKEIIGGI